MQPGSDEKKDVKRVHGQKMKGKCKWYDITKGFGFILAEDGGPDVFVHQTEIQATRARALCEGQEVEFIYVTDSNKIRAKEVTAPGGIKVQTHASLLDPNFAKRLRGDPTIKLGIAKWFDTKKGYGFLVPLEGGDDLFVHQSEIKSLGFRALTEGQDLEYKIKIETAPDGKELKKAKEVTGPGGFPLQPPGGGGLIPTPFGYPGYSPFQSPLPSPVPSRSSSGSVSGTSILGANGTLRPKTGTVKWYDPSKNYGFIIPSDGSQEVFAHQSNIQGFGGYRSLLPGQPVEYTVETKDGHVRALNITGPGGTPIMPPTPTLGPFGTSVLGSNYQTPYDNFGKRKAPVSSSPAYKAPRTESTAGYHPDLSLYSTQTYSSPQTGGSDYFGSGGGAGATGGGAGGSSQTGYGSSQGYGSSPYTQSSSNPYAAQMYGGGGLFGQY